MRRVEAMIQPVSASGSINAVPTCDDLRRAITALDEYLGGFEGEDDERPKPELAEIVRLARAVKEQFNSFDNELDEHDCSAAGQSLVPVGSNEPLDTLLRREGFNSADMVAIVKLDDLASSARTENILRIVNAHFGPGADWYFDYVNREEHEDCDGDCLVHAALREAAK